MGFTFETVYEQKAFTAMAKALRKTVRRKRSRRSHIFGWFVVVLGLLLTVSDFGDGIIINMKNIVTWLAALCILVVLIWEDAMNGYMARRRMLKGMERTITEFKEEHYTSVTELGRTEWQYDKIVCLAETTGYFVFVFSANHAQVYDKASISGGSVEEFRAFIEEKTGKSTQRV